MKDLEIVTKIGELIGRPAVKNDSLSSMKGSLSSDEFLYKTGKDDISIVELVISVPTTEYSDEVLNLIGQLNKLELFGVSQWNSFDFEFLKSLQGLRTLQVENSSLTNLNSISKLVNLEYIWLIGCQLKDVHMLGELPKLERINLSNNIRIDLQHLLPIAKQLKTLWIYNSKVKNIGHIAEFIFLDTLSFGKTGIDEIPNISRLKKLRKLHLMDNKIKDISILGKLPKLLQIKLDNNIISDIKPLLNLRPNRIDLQDNSIEVLPSGIAEMGCEIVWDRYVGLKESKLKVKKIILDNNPLTSPPSEIVQQGHQSVLDWFKANKRSLNEIKIILLGDPKAGKTSLLKRLKENVFDPKEVQTDGINIEDVVFGECETFYEQKSLHHLTGHFWDFGGQEIMNATHQFFLTNRSVYVLVLDARKDNNSAIQIRQWVKRIKSTGGNSSIIVVANQSDVNPGFGFENEYELQKEFPQIKYFIKASCSTGIGIDTLKDRLEELIPKAELFNSTIDERWIDIKESLQRETKSNHFLDEKRFFQICLEHNLTEKRPQQNAIKFLHDLGLVLHFESVHLTEYYVLDPYWITYGVYQILTSKYAGELKGIVGMDKLDFIINEEEDKHQVYRPSNYVKINYSNNQRRFLVDILHQFKLCFYVSDRAEFIIPDLLTTNEPNEATEPLRRAPESIQFVYEYDYLPKSTIPRIMVACHKLLTSRWRTGCILQKNDCKALITNYRNRLTIVVIGDHKQKREFMSIIRHLIDDINSELSDKPRMLIPLPGEKGEADYLELLEKEKDGERYHTVYLPVKERFEIATLLDGITNPSEVDKLSERMEAVLSNTEDIMCRVAEIKSDTTNLLDNQDKQLEYLDELLQNSLTKEKIQLITEEAISKQSDELLADLMDGISNTIELMEADLDTKLDVIYTDLMKCSDLEMKLKLSVPFISLLGINIETEFDIKAWGQRMYDKYELELFKLVGAV